MARYRIEVEFDAADNKSAHDVLRGCVEAAGPRGNHKLLKETVRPWLRYDVVTSKSTVRPVPKASQ